MMDFFTFDADYIRRLCTGDALIGEHFHVYFRGLLTRQGRRTLRTVDEIDDVIQEVFARVLKSVCADDALREGSRLGAFVHTVAVNVIHEKQREKTRTNQLPEAFDLPSREDLEELFATREAVAIVRKILSEMSEKDARLLRGWFEGRDKDEMCRELGVDRAYLRVLVHRALQRFKDLFKKR